MLFVSCKIQLSIKRICDNIRFQFPCIRRKNTHVGRKIIIYFHETDRNQAVEPGIGNLFNDIFISSLIVGILFLLSDHLYQFSSLLHRISTDGIRFCGSNIIKFSCTYGLRQSIFNTICRNTHQSCTVTDICNELISSPDRKVFDG